jgi:hypothetical protein
VTRFEFVVAVYQYKAVDLKLNPVRLTMCTGRWSLMTSLPLRWRCGWPPTLPFPTVPTRRRPRQAWLAWSRLSLWVRSQPPRTAQLVGVSHAVLGWVAPWHLWS